MFFAKLYSAMQKLVRRTFVIRWVSRFVALPRLGLLGFEEFFVGRVLDVADSEEHEGGAEGVGADAALSGVGDEAHAYI